MKAKQSDEELITASAARAELGNVSESTIWRWERDGILPLAKRINKRKFWLRSEIAELKRRASAPGGLSR